MNEETLDATSGEYDAQDDQNIATSGEQEETQETQVDVDPEEKPRVDRAQKRIDRLTREKYEERRERLALQAELERLKGGGNNNQQQQPDIATVIRQEAAAIVAEEKFNDACNKTYAQGKKDFQDFDDAIANLSDIDIASKRDFLEAVAESDHGAKLLYYLAKDLDEAERIASLPPRRMGSELAKLELKLATTKQKTTSNAPAPVKSVGTGKASSSSDLSDFENYLKWARETR